MSVLNPMQIAAIVDLLRARLPQTQCVFLYGSHAAGSATASSDIDVAWLGDPGKIDAMVLHQLRQELELLTRRDVDLVDLTVASTVLQKQVVAYGRRLYDSDPNATDAFIAFVFGRYARLNDERAEILKKIAATGSIYGDSSLLATRP